ncbi:transcriptional regulator [Planotetraspora thailandica]|uniref:Transcriptional regulator n=1 Tax=Planotetraspora thailandica TaxID=487172 RepID=A0A8J3Y2B1_9ACTN|nr:winged helix-turn-helix transcriptional regulator [Planotetraspora thailandica]GII59598.1 transcriptional regulator [Planotetraspora thailandica]
MSHVIDFVARRRESGLDASPADDASVLSMVPIPGSDTALVIVAHVVPLEEGRQIAQLAGTALPGLTPVAEPAPQGPDTARPAGPSPAATGTRTTRPVHAVPHRDEAARQARSRPAAQQPTPVEELVVDRAARAVRVDGTDVDLTYREFELLDYLLASPGRVFNRRQLMAAVWDRYGDEGARTVDVHVLRLRRKLGRHAGRIVTVRNVGYKYQQPRA